MRIGSDPTRPWDYPKSQGDSLEIGRERNRLVGFFRPEGQLLVQLYAKSFMRISDLVGPCATHETRMNSPRKICQSLGATPASARSDWHRFASVAECTRLALSTRHCLDAHTHVRLSPSSAFSVPDIVPLDCISHNTVDTIIRVATRTATEQFGHCRECFSKLGPAFKDDSEVYWHVRCNVSWRNRHAAMKRHATATGN